MVKIIIFTVILCCLPLTYLFGPSTKLVDAKQPKKNPISVRLVSTSVGPLESEHVQLGNKRLKYKGTLLLDSPHPAFGGFSDLLISEDRKSFLAVTDMGFWMTAGLRYSPDGFLAGVSEQAQLGQLLNTEGKTYAVKYNADAEGLCRAPESGYIVSYERVHRLNVFKNNKLSLAGTPVNHPIPAKLKSLPENDGIETLLLLPDKSIFILSENDHDFKSISYAATFKNGKWRDYKYIRSDDFLPTSAGNLPDNNILVLERRYKGPGTLGIRIRKFSADKMDMDKEIVPELFLEIKAPLPRDNFEGMDTITTSDGHTYIYIMSDDNFSPVQHTLLTLFELLPKD